MEVIHGHDPVGGITLGPLLHGNVQTRYENSRSMTAHQILDTSVLAAQYILRFREITTDPAGQITDAVHSPSSNLADTDSLS